MPTVPEYGDNRVQEQGLPSVRVSGEVPLSSLNAGQTSQDVYKSNLALQDAFQKEAMVQQQRADKVVDLDFKAKMADYENRLLYGTNGEGGALSMQGNNALDFQPTLDAYSKYASELSGKFKTDNQRESASNEARVGGLQVGSKLSNHAMLESERLHTEKFASFVKNKSNLAIMSGDPGQINKTARELMVETDSFGDYKGWDFDKKFEMASALVSKFYSDLVTDQLNAGKYNMAQATYDQKLPEILPDDRRNLKGALRVGTDRAKVQALSDEIFNNSKYPEKADAQGKIDSIASKDPEIGALLNANLRERYDQKEAQGKVLYARGYDTARSSAIDSPNVPPNLAVSAPVWYGLSPEDRQKIINSARPPANPDAQLMIEFRSLGVDGWSKMTLNDLNRDYIDNGFNQDQRTEAYEIWKNARASANEPDKANKAFSQEAFDRMTWDTAQKNGVMPFGQTIGDIKKDRKLSKELLDYTLSVKRQIDYEKYTNGGREVSAERQQKIADGLAIESKVSGNKYLYQNMVEFKEIPISDRNAIAKYLRDDGQVPTQAKIETFYAGSKRKGK